MKYQAALFDLDGTLLNTLQDLSDAVNYGLSQFGYPLHNPEEYKQFIGAGREVLATLAIPPEHRDPATIKQLIADIDVYYDQHWTDHTLPYPGIPEMLDGLTEAGIKMAVLSNKPHNFAELNVGQLLDKWHFEAVVGAMPGIPHKPDPTAALNIARQMKIDPAGFLYLGDSGIDMQTAVAAGMYPVGAVWGFRCREELQACGAKTLLEKPTQLLKLLG